MAFLGQQKAICHICAQLPSSNSEAHVGSIHNERNRALAHGTRLPDMSPRKVDSATRTARRLRPRVYSYHRARSLQNGVDLSDISDPQSNLGEQEELSYGLAQAVRPKQLLDDSVC